MVVAAGCWILGPRPGPKPRMARVRPRRGHEAGQIGSSLELGLAGHTRYYLLDIMGSFRYLKVKSEPAFLK